jgi:hypothetical protein
MTDERIKEIVHQANDLNFSMKMRTQVLELVDELHRLRAIIDNHLSIGVWKNERSNQGS